MSNENLWKPVVDYEGLYEVSNQGRVRNCRTKRVLRPGSSRGYLIVMLRKDGKSLPLYVHQLVLKAFVGDRPINMAVSHIDGNKSNNDVENLCWESYGANNSRRNYRGESHIFAKVNSSQVQEIVSLYASRKYTQLELGKFFGLSRTQIGAIVRGEKWSHITNKELYYGPTT